MIVATQEEVQCDHCGLPVPAGLQDQWSDRKQFCCQGCETAFEIIHGTGLDAFYRMRGDVGSEPNRQRSSEVYPEFDSEVFLDKFSTWQREGVRSVKLGLTGLHCAACIWLIERLPKMLPGVIESRVNWSRATVQIVWQTERVSLSTIAQTLSRIGYEPYPIRESDRFRSYRKQNRQHMVRLGIAGAIAGNNMLLSAALYSGMFAQMSAGTTQLLRIVSCLCGVHGLAHTGKSFPGQCLERHAESRFTHGPAHCLGAGCGDCRWHRERCSWCG